MGGDLADLRRFQPACCGASLLTIGVWVGKALNRQSIAMYPMWFMLVTTATWFLDQGQHGV